ncbi:MAG TPA: DUF4124 domain-containing protein [Halioglobus sp.]
MSRCFLFALLLIPLTGWCDSVYRTTDEHGNVVFTDTPPANNKPAERVELNHTNTAESPPNLAPPAQVGTQDKESDIPPTTVTITDPPNETSYPMGPGNFSVSVDVSSPLATDENLQLFMDGAAWGSPQQATRWNLTNVFRGQHDLTVGVVDNTGKTQALSTPVRVFVHRPSTNFKNRQPPPKPKPPRPQPK